MTPELVTLAVKLQGESARVTLEESLTLTSPWFLAKLGFSYSLVEPTSSANLKFKLLFEKKKISFQAAEFRQLRERACAVWFGCSTVRLVGRSSTAVSQQTTSELGIFSDASSQVVERL